MIELLQKHPFFQDKPISSCELLQTQGYCNENYLVIANGQKYIVRKFLRTDIDRIFEYKVHTLAFQKGISSEPLHLDNENGIMISRYAEGVHKESLDENELMLLANTLQELHSIQIDSEPTKLEIKTQSPIVEQALKTIAKHDREQVLCHNDLNPKNLLFSENLRLIDWEYAGVNDRYFDLASVCVEFELDSLQEAYFLARYFQEKKSDQEKLESYKIVYKVLCEEWFTELSTQSEKG